MNELVRNSIDARKTALFNGYEINNQAILDKIDDLFNRIYEFGENCADSMDFETKFASNSLNQEYIQLFTEVATNCKSLIGANSNQDTNVENTEGSVANEVADELLYEAESMVQPVKRQVRQEVYDQVRDIPVVGDVLEIKQHVDFFSRFKKKKDKE